MKLLHGTGLLHCMCIDYWQSSREELQNVSLEVTDNCLPKCSCGLWSEELGKMGDRESRDNIVRFEIFG